jgi:hypothetical protein
METYADKVIDALGGTSEVSRSIEAPTSTVHSWRKIGIPSSRLAPEPPAEAPQDAAA